MLKQIDGVLHNDIPNLVRRPPPCAALVSCTTWSCAHMCVACCADLLPHRVTSLRAPALAVLPHRRCSLAPQETARVPYKSPSSPGCRSMCLPCHKSALDSTKKNSGGMVQGRARSSWSSAHRTPPAFLWLTQMKAFDNPFPDYNKQK